VYADLNSFSIPNFSVGLNIQINVLVAVYKTQNRKWIIHSIILF